MENYGKMLDMFDLAFMMQGNSEGITLDDIQERFGVGRRTAERMRNAIANYFAADFLEEYGDDNKKHFRLTSNKLTGLASLTKSELAAINSAIKHLQKNNLDEKAKNLETARNKFLSLIKPKSSVAMDVEDILKSEGLALRPGPKIKMDNTIVSVLRDALHSFRQIKIDYFNQSSGKINYTKLIPMGFVYGDRNHYLLAKYVDGRSKGELRYYILGNIKKVTILKETFEEDAKFSLEKYVENSFGTYQEEPFDVEWLFAKEAADEAERYVFHPTQKVKRKKDGSLLVKFRAGGRREMSWHLYTWGDKVKVIKPTNFWESLPEY